MKRLAPAAQRARPAPERDEQTDEPHLHEPDDAEHEEDGVVRALGHGRAGIAVAGGAGVKDLRREEEEKRHEELRVASCELRGPPPQGSHSQPATRNPQPLHSSLSFFTTYIPYQISAAPQITNSTASVSAALLCVAAYSRNPHSATNSDKPNAAMMKTMWKIRSDMSHRPNMS